MLHKQSVVTPTLTYSTYRNGRSTHLRPYPPGTKAFLYYAPGKPRISGGLRLRVVSSDDPASFASGSDLLLTNGQPWSRPLHVLPKYHARVYEKLREEQLIPDDLHAALSAIPKTFGPNCRSRFLYTLHDTFIIDFSQNKQNLCVVTEKDMELLPCLVLFFDHRATYAQPPYQGTVHKLSVLLG